MAIRDVPAKLAVLSSTPTLPSTRPASLPSLTSLPRLAWLHRALDELRGTLDATVWAQDWHTHFLRLTALLADNTTAAERDAAARAVSDADRELIGQLLTGRYTA